ncbi:hypothetical protein BJX64DRAFT_9088 [Aspergillus heterothallicus]
MELESFPHFADGDVRITILPDIYRLHSSLLKDESGVLRKLLDRSQPLFLSLEQQRQCGACVGCLRLNLVGSSIHKYGMLEVQGYDDSHCTMDQFVPRTFPVWPDRVRHVWVNMFRIIHGAPPILDEDGYDLILENCQALIELGDDIQASDIVSRALNTALHNLDQHIYRSIAQDPVSWVELAVYIQSAPVFQESMIHLVGKWGLVKGQERDSLTINIRNICERKVEHLNEIKKAAKLQIVNYGPGTLLSASRCKEASNVYVWMASTYHQQWLCQSLAEGRNYRASDGGASFYRAIASAGDAYLNRLGKNTFHFITNEIDNGDTKGLEVFEMTLHELKEGIRNLVSDLLIDHAKYDPGIFGELPYLTCCQVAEEEMPPKPKTAMAGDYAVENSEANVNGSFRNGSNIQYSYFNNAMSNRVQLSTNATAYNDHLTNYYLPMGMQDHFGFDGSNVMQQWGWADAADYSSATLPLPMPLLADMTTGIYQTQMDENDDFDEINVFGIVPTFETEEHSPNDESKAFI